MSAAASAALIAWPPKAAFGRAIPKSKIYEHSRASARLKDLFARQVERIVWQYKLAPETINLPARPGVPEIQIFSVQIRGAELNEDVLRAIDAAVQYPVLFELTRGEGNEARAQFIAAYKRPSEADASRWVQSGYFASTWLAASCTRVTLPIALDLAALYVALLRPLLPLPARPRESLPDQISRVERVAAKRREVEKTEQRLAREKQFNRRVEINAALRQQKIELEQLSG